ncbi:uncharacterized protein LOC118753680 [Rhagoletis pomonella]|uniref:uncharacterized protein LOC118753680 n=1 Tax=Rhagoletis pomonella TaxID=28610 RepID=UPI0017844FAB|nr:uncharacterized protein LOC118753680 [Rhagoletis pomonella]
MKRSIKKYSPRNATPGAKNAKQPKFLLDTTDMSASRKNEIELTIESRRISSARQISVSNEYTIESRRVSVAATIETHAGSLEPPQNVYEVVCCSHCSTFEKKFEKLEGTIKELRRVVESQNVAIMDAIATQKVATEQLVRQESENAPVVKYFPLNNLEELAQLESKLSAANRDIFESAISSIICNNMKNVSLVLRTQLIHQINVDGSHGKVGLKKFPNFFCVFTGAVSKLPFKGLTPEEIIRRTLQFEKAKQYKRIYREKKKQN